MTRKLERVNFTIKRELGSLIASRLNDPRLSVMVSVTRVETAPDLGSARVHVSVLGDEAEQSAGVEALNAAAGLLAHELDARIRIRRTPRLRFQLDDQLASGESMSELIDQVRDEDRRRRTRRKSQVSQSGADREGRS